MTSVTMTPARRERADNAWRWLEARLEGRAMPPLVAFIGLGDGAVLDALDERSPGTRVLALEPNTQDAQAMLNSPELASRRQSGRLVYLCDPDYAGADQAWRIFPNGITAPPVIVHPDIIPDECATRAAQQLKRIIHGVEANAEARRRFAPRYLVNSLRNLPAIVAGSDVNQLRDAYRGMPAIVAGAGPSLDAAIPHLRAMPNRGLLIAADTALRPLLAGGIAPHFVAALDPGQLNLRHFLSLPECRDTWLVSESALDRQATALFEGRTFWFRVANHHPWPWFNEMGLDAGHLEVWGSVLTAAFQIARLAGCNPIVFAGADLSFTNGRPYARGTTYEFNWAESVAAGYPLASLWQDITTRDSDPMTDLRGEATRTTGIMISIRDWLVAQAGRSGRRIVNASGAGMLFGQGIEQAALPDVLSGTIAIPPPATLARRAVNVRPSAIAKQVRAIRTALASQPPRGLVSAWHDFSGGGFDPSSVGAALDEAAHSLETKRGIPVPTSVIRWEREDGGAQMADTLCRLSEVLARMPGMLDTPTPTATDADDTPGDAGRAIADDRAARLLHAWDLLERICDSVLHRRDDLTMREAAWRLGTGRIFPFYDWPETTRWAVMLFEASLAELGDPFEPPASARAGDRSFPRPLSTPAGPPDRHSLPNARCACTLLVLAWLRSAGLAPWVVEQLAHSLRDRAVTLASGDAGAGDSWMISVEMSRGGAAAAAELRVSFNASLVILMRTGLVQETMSPLSSPASAGLSTLLALSGIEAPDLSAAIETRERSRRRAPAIVSSPRVETIFRRPRVLTHAGGIGHLLVGYPHRDGVVCVKPAACENVLVTEDGAVRPHRTWPRPIQQELPLGEDGAVAWNNGLTNFPQVGPAFVMYRRHSGDDVTIQELPFRPAYGQWCEGRLYWSCFSRVEGWQGLASWAPGEALVAEAPGLISWAVHPDGDDLVLHPCAFTPATGFQRALRSTGWKIASRSRSSSAPATPAPVPLGPYGAVAGRATRGSWTALAHPDIDVVRLESHDGRGLSLTCPAPLRVAWLGNSLLVGTLNAELLLFDDLLTAIDRGRTMTSS